MGTGHPTAVIHHNIHHIHIRPITNIGTSSFVAVTFIPYQPRRVYCRPEAVAFVTLSLTTGICPSAISHSSHSHSPHYQHRDKIVCRWHFVTHRPHRVHCLPEAVAFVTPSPPTGLCSFQLSRSPYPHSPHSRHRVKIVSLSISLPVNHVGSTVILALSPSSLYHRLQDFDH